MSVTINGTNNSVVFPGTTSGQITLSATPASGTHIQYLPNATGTLLLSNVTMNFPTTLGTAGNVLTTDGAGNLYWGVGGGGAPITVGSTTIVGGSNRSIVFDDAGTFGEASFITTNGGSILTLGDSISGVTGQLILASNAFNSVTLRASSSATASYTLTFPVTAGSAGQLLTTDGTGTTSWTTVSPGGGGTVTSISLDPTTTGLTINGATTAQTITTSGTFNIGGILDIAHGGTGLNAVGPAGEVLVSNGTTAGWAAIPPAADLANGVAGSVPYQTAPGSTAFVPVGTSGQILQSNGAGAPSWVNVPNAPSIAGGIASQVLYQSSPGVTSFVPNGTVGQSLLSNGVGAPAWGPVNLALAGAVTGILPIANGGTGLNALGAGVQTALSNPAGGANGFATLNASGILPTAQGGIGGALNAGWTTILGAAPGTGVGTALGINVGTAGSFVTNGGDLGTPSAGVLTNATGLPLTTGVTGILPIANGGTGLGVIGTANQVLTSDGTNAVWANTASAATAIDGGAASEILYQSAPGVTDFIPNGVSGEYLKSNGALAPQWATPSTTIGTTAIPLDGTTASLAGVDFVTLTQDPPTAMDAATKQYVDLATSSVNRIAPVDAATTGPVILSGAQTVDGVPLVGGERVLVKNQVAAADNGVYDVGTPWTRAADANTWNEYIAAQVYVLNGTTQDNTSWIQTSPAGGTLGVTALNWEQTSGVNSYAAGTGLTLATNVFSNAGVLSFSGGFTGLLPAVATTGAVSLSGTLLPGYGGTGLNALGTGVQTALGLNTNSAGGFPTLNGSGVLPVAQGGTGLSTLGTGVATALGTNVGATNGFLTVGATPLTNNGIVLGTSTAGQLGSTAVGTTGQILIGQTAAAPIWSSTVTLGVQGTTAGVLRLANTNVGNFPTTIQSASGATMAWTLTLPPDDGVAGYVLETDGLGNTNWVYNGGTTYTAGSVLFGSATGTITEDNANLFFDDTLNLFKADDVYVWRGLDHQVNNVGIGTNALAANAGGTDNSAVGMNSLDAVTSGSRNTGLGFNTLSAVVSTSDNTAVGSGALALNTAAQNTAVGSGALDANTTGTPNTAMGYNALGANVVGTNNVAVGDNALAANTGNENTAVGSRSLTANTNGGANTAIGAFSQLSNTTGNWNTSVGEYSLQNNISGSANTSMGWAALVGNTASGNTAFGYQSLQSNTSGTPNTAVGYQALNANVSGTNNVAVGDNALAASTGSQNTAVGSSALPISTASYNTAFGYGAMLSTTTGDQNTAIGRLALQANTTGRNNTAVGNGAIYSNTIGIQNTAVGGGALLSNVSGNYNTAIGLNALNANTADNNTAVGRYALNFNTTGTPNTAVGYNALTSNISGTNNVAVGDSALAANTANFNTAVGSGALYSNTTGVNNTAIGGLALNSNTGGQPNVAVGYESLRNNTAGSANTAVGPSALFSNVSGNQNCAFGNQSLASCTGNNNSAIGAFSGNDPLITITNQNDYVVLGNNGTSVIYGKVPPTNPSDIRDKNIAGSVPHGLDFVKQIETIEYTFKTSREDDTPHGRVHYGFSAQNLLALEGDKAVIIDTSNEDKLAFNGASLIPVLVNAIQELSAQVEELKKKVK